MKTRISKTMGAVAGVAAIAMSIPLAINAYAEPAEPTPTVIENPYPDLQGPGCDAFKTSLPNFKTLANVPVGNAMSSIPDISTFNSLASGQANPAVNMVPMLGFRRGKPLFALGAPGGRKIVSTVPQIVSNMLDAGDSPQAAMEAPRLHTEGGDLWVDDRAGEASLRALGRMRHSVVPRHVDLNAFHFARPVAIRIDRHGLEAGLDPLCDASAAGV